MRKKLLFIYNPNAGMGRIKSKLSGIIEIMSNAGYEVVSYPTKAKSDARERVMEHMAENICDRIVCAGGDGTLNEVASGVMSSGKVIPIGYIPSGTTNDFGYSLRIPKNYIKAAELAVHGMPLHWDIGSINMNYFTYTAAFGLFTDVSYETPQNLKNVLGRAAYILSSISKLTNVKSHRICVDYEDNMIEDEFLFGLFSNSDSVGGFKGLVGKDIMFDDGLFEMLLVKMPHNVIELNATVMDLLKGTMESNNIHYARISKVYITTKELLPWSIDGEDGGSITHAEIVVHKQAVQYICGRR